MVQAFFATFLLELANDMYFICYCEYNLSPTERRRQLREKGDVGRFAVK